MSTKNIEPIKHSDCHKVLPLIYDDSLSYYEILCKLVNKMNEIIAFLSGTITGTIKEYLNEQFNELMINAIYDSETETIIFSNGIREV